MGHILDVQNLNKSFKDFTLDDVSFTLKKGYIMGFIGPNGSGKTTTIKLIMNLTCSRIKLMPRFKHLRGFNPHFLLGHKKELLQTNCLCLVRCIAASVFLRIYIDFY